MRRIVTGLAMTLAMNIAVASADEIEDSLKAALEAYQAGDVNGAREEIDYARQLLLQMRAESLAKFLPAPLDGWSRRDDENSGTAMGALGGGMMAGATYTRKDNGETVEIQIMADNQMVASMAAMFANPALMGTMGKLKRINRQKVVITPEGEIQALVDGRILVSVSGSAPVEDKEAYFRAIDIKALKEF